ncbi:MFS transporter [Massilia sp. W12]|uniref:MFS transporter n=1 Tax=Massilia sp. W12 TaxID=3126507 RepID=UPI0030D110D2
MHKFILLASLYIAQGLPYGYFTQALPVLLREQGLSLHTIGLGGVLALPWALKFLWSPLVDRLQCHRRWILLCNLAAVLCCLFLAAFDLQDLIRNKLWLLYLGFFCLNLAAASQDIATDALAVMLLSESERGLGNGVQVAAYRLGMIASGGALLSAFGLLGWQVSTLILAAMLCLCCVPLLLMPALFAVTQQRPAMPVLDLRRMFALALAPDMRPWLAALCAYKFGETLATPMLRPMLVDHGLNLADLALLLGTVGFGAGLAGSICGGLLLNRLGRALALRLFLGLTGLSIASWSWLALARPGIGWLQAACALEHFSAGMATTALFAEMMRHCRSHWEATDYTLQASLVVMLTIAAAALSGFLAQAMGYAAFFILCSACSLLAFWPLTAYLRSKAAN